MYFQNDAKLKLFLKNKLKVILKREKVGNAITTGRLLSQTGKKHYGTI